MVAAVAVAATAWGVWQWTQGPEPALPGALATSQDDARTAYPIVLVHGMMGFDQLWAYEYWRGIPQRLGSHGARVYLTQVSAFNSSEVRGEQLLTQVQQLVVRTGAKKVNLIGHSHGSHASRYVAAKRPDLVASVTSVAGPNTGSEVADWLQSASLEHPWMVQALLALGNGVGHFINWASDSDWPQDAGQSMASLSRTGAAAFNQAYPAGIPETPCGQGAAEVDGVRYYSWSGVGRFYRALNPTDYGMVLTHMLFKGEDSDGLVGRCASHLGQVIRDDYPMNHFHAVNQLWGLVSPDVDPAGLFLEHARRLKQAGL